MLLLLPTGCAGLYQVNAMAPAGVPTGSAVNVTLSIVGKLARRPLRRYSRDRRKGLKAGGGHSGRRLPPRWWMRKKWTTRFAFCWRPWSGRNTRGGLLYSFFEEIAQNDRGASSFYAVWRRAAAFALRRRSQ